ncbi:hypothetical protein HHK36_012861 [Tetracentron sinense]|uniref:Uncharacterized protein n=1 Tax=Tetracentron sinense TaxID=13715 RepID=A0A835DG35_TETSI|nr:hypothetical protein HHK36_012861 [Tetracentron sinense]
MSRELSNAEGNSFSLLKQLEDILECDPLIDEIGFIHPSQFMALNEDRGHSLHLFGNNVLQSADEILSTDIPDSDVKRPKNTNFWNRDHKLAISTEALLPLYGAARHAFMDAIRQYKMLRNLPIKTDRFVEETVPKSCLVSEELIESEVMKHSKALLLLSSDFGTAWNSRKLVVSKRKFFSMFMEELLLSALVLSYSPKSEHAWSHRRWAIKMIAGKCPSMQEIVRKESELVEEIAEGLGARFSELSKPVGSMFLSFSLQKSKMNYRAWNHRCWLVSYMTSGQVLDGLNNSRKWARLHVADNCCFHYRSQLMLRMLRDSCSEQDLDLCSGCMPNLYQVWKDELDWDEMLIKQYIGREALWLHRRFLSQFWIKHFAADLRGAPFHPEGHSGINHGIGIFIDNELRLFHSCLAVPDNDFEDGQAQAVLAAAYILWVSKQIAQSEGIELQEKLREVGDLKTLLNKVCPEKTLLWNGLIGQVGGI